MDPWDAKFLIIFKTTHFTAKRELDLVWWLHIKRWNSLYMQALCLFKKIVTAHPLWAKYLTKINEYLFPMWRNTFLDNQSKETCADLINYMIQIQILCLYQWHLSRFLSWKCIPCLPVDLASVWVSIACPDIVLGGKSAIVTLYTHYLSYEKIETNEKSNMQGTVRRPDSG